MVFINKHFAVSSSLVVVAGHWGHISGDEEEGSAKHV